MVVLDAVGLPDLPTRLFRFGVTHEVASIVNGAEVKAPRQRFTCTLMSDDDAEAEADSMLFESASGKC